MAREDQQLKLRLPQTLKEGVETAARENKRSINAEIVARLEATFASPGADEPLEVIVERASRSAVLSAITTIFDSITNPAEKSRVLRKLRKPGGFTITHEIKEPEKP